MKSILFILLIHLGQSLIYAQNRYINWYFGYGAGLSFNNSGPTIISGGQTSTEEGVATISDPCGNLLFYSDGTTIWNKNHKVMINGAGIKGNIQSAEAALIVPKPLSDSLYYVFTTDDYGGDDGVQYSIVDISKQAGDGELISKNNKLYGKSSEKLAAVLHANKKDYWIITHDWDSACYKVFLLTDEGLNTSPVVSKLGPITNTSIENALGHLRPSPDGLYVASTFWNQNVLEVYKFDNIFGSLAMKYSSNQFDHQRPYSIEFSPDNKLLYVGEAASGGANDIYQFEISSFSTSVKRYLVTTANYRFGNFGIGPDGKFYIAKFDQNYLAIINNPNTYGFNCNYVDNGFSLGSQKSKLGLPNSIFPIIIQNPEYSFSAISGCNLNEPVKFELLSNFCYDSLVWDLSDVTSSDNNSRKKKLSHVYPYRGNYDVTLTVYFNGKAYVINKNIKVPNTPIVDLGKDTALCESKGYFVDAGNFGATYEWNDGNKSKIRNLTKSGKYWVTVTLGKCVGSDTLQFINDSTVSLGKDTTDCFKSNLSLANKYADSIIWSDGFKGTTRVFNSPSKTYYANVFNGKCTKPDTITVFLPELFNIKSPKDTTLCDGESIVINILDKPFVKYLWNDGSTIGAKTINKAGFYELIQTSGNCVSILSFNIKITDKFKLQKFSDTLICYGEKLNYTIAIKDGIWMINDLIQKGNSYHFDTIGHYFIKAENKCLKDSFYFQLLKDSCSKIETIFPNVYSPNGDILNDIFRPTIIGDYLKIKEYNFKVYNRWGELIYETSMLQNGWDGTYSSQPCQIGTYFWICNYKLNELGESKSYQLNGQVSLVR
jgi:gliding motility-associated-like protein